MQSLKRLCISQASFGSKNFEPRILFPRSYFIAELNHSKDAKISERGWSQISENMSCPVPIDADWCWLMLKKGSIRFNFCRSIPLEFLRSFLTLYSISNLLMTIVSNLIFLTTFNMAMSFSTAVRFCCFRCCCCSPFVGAYLRSLSGHF